MEVKTIKLTWEELDTIFEGILKEILGKTIKCSANFDDYSYWAVQFEDYEMPVEEIELICNLVKANFEERREALPPDNEPFSRDFGMSISVKLLSLHLTYTWNKIFADEDALYLLECARIGE